MRQLHDNPRKHVSARDHQQNNLRIKEGQRNNAADSEHHDKSLFAAKVQILEAVITKRTDHQERSTQDDQEPEGHPNPGVDQIPSVEMYDGSDDSGTGGRRQPYKALEVGP